MARQTATGQILLTGATGFVGRNLYPRLVERNYQVRCATRDAARAERKWPHRQWVQMDVERPVSLRRALQGCDAAYYLVHRMADVGDFESEEARGAMNFLEAATDLGVRRIVYLGGVRPAGQPAPHLRSRLVTGAILRSGEVSTVELQASMIIGPKSASWQILRDLAVRLPVMLCPRWLKNHTEPVAMDDAMAALLAAVELELEEGQSATFPIPGPDILTFRQCIETVSALVGNRPWMVDVPFLTPRLSSYWLRVVTGADYHVAKALAEGLKDDLVADDDSYWERIDHRRRLPFREAAKRTLAAEEMEFNRYERAVHTLVERRRGAE